MPRADNPMLTPDRASGHEVVNHHIYGELLAAHSTTIREIREQIQIMLGELEEKKELCTAKRILLNTFKKDIQESFTDCRTTIKKNITAMINYLKQQQDEMLHEIDQTVQYNLEQLAAAGASVDRTVSMLEQQVEEGKSLLREQDTFTFFAKGSLFRQLPCVPVPRLHLEFRDNFPELTSLSLQPFQVPMQHAVQVDIREFLQSGVHTRICGNIFHNGFRFQIQLKHDDRYLSAYLCLRAWHDVAAFLRVTVNFTLSLLDGPENLHSASAKNTFEGPNDGWGWNKFLALSKLAPCTDVTFLVTFNEMAYSFLSEELNPPKQTDIELDSQQTPSQNANARESMFA